uniref:Chymotrypsin-like serine protease 16 n=1 Tax=Ostrinia nubilalis TaxID=29057 RepID=I6SW54_OSTNU|nr:chymotrypsin-like serine protease 16 [Ostrinia nubilalis]
MAVKTGILFFTLLVGCLAIPKPASDDLSQFFEHANPDSRIVGGTVAAIGAHPHMVAMSNGVLIRSFVCGGSLISSRTVLTAAHCIAAVFSFGSLSSSLRVTVGTNNWNQGGVAYGLARNVTHEHYVSQIIKNDIGVLITSSPVVFTNLVQPITVSYDYAGAGIQSRAAGWGRIRAGGPISAQLLELTVTTISGDQCVRDVAQASVDFNVAAPPVEPHVELCIIHSPNHGMCNGDSGSALVRLDRGTQIGIVSWGFPGARGAPDMFVRVSAFQEWVARHFVA